MNETYISQKKILAVDSPRNFELESIIFSATLVLTMHQKCSCKKKRYDMISWCFNANKPKTETLTSQLNLREVELNGREFRLNQREKELNESEEVVKEREHYTTKRWLPRGDIVTKLLNIIKVHTGGCVGPCLQALFKSYFGELKDSESKVEMFETNPKFCEKMPSKSSW